MNWTRDKAMAASQADWLTGGGEMGKLIREMDWSQTPVGPLDSWPHSLKTAVNILLNSHYPMFIWWGSELTNIYNDAYIPMLGARHPQALGQSAPRVWAEVWPVVGPQTEVVMREGRATWNESILLVMERHGYTEETYFTFSYSPAPDDTGRVGGVFCAVTEDTERMLGERRLKTLRDLGERSLAEAKTVEQACRAAAITLADNLHDFPFALIYLLDEDGKLARLCETINLPAGTKASPSTVTIGSGDDVWNFSQVIKTSQSRIAEDLEERFGRLPAGPWTDDWTKRALALALAKTGAQEFPAGFLVTGTSPRLVFNDNYYSFLDLTAGQIATAISNARAHEEERKRAESLAEMDRAKTAFFSNVSHEFRTPLTLMLGPLEDTLAQDDLPPGERERLEIAHRNSLRLLKLVNTLLDFSRIEAGRVEAVYEPVDLATFTAELASLFRSVIEKAGMKLVVDCPRLGEPVYIDRGMWEKIVLNLLSNAFKFTFEGEIKVTLRPAGERVELTVSDTGTGIPAEELPRLFDRFYRVKGARGRSYEGSGIGIPLVQELVTLHGGDVRVTSEVDRGSAFTVSIPTGKAHLPADRIGAAHTHSSPGLRGEAYIEEAQRWLPSVMEGQREGEKVGKMDRGRDSAKATHSVPQSPGLSVPPSRILLADDNADMREYVRRLLNEQYEVVAVADGEEALKATREHTFDLILTDVMMPRLDGFGLLRELRDDERTREIPVILLSARAGEESKIEGLEAGANDYLVKPFSARELLARVEAKLQVQRVRRESQEALRASEQKFSAAFNQSPLPMTISSLDDGRLVEVNESFVRLSGYTREEALGRTTEELRLLVELERRDEGLKLLRAGQPVYSFDARILTRSGDERIGMIRSSLIEINSRQHVLNSFTDLTKRKQAEDAIRQLAAIVESSDDAIVSKDLNGVIKSWNKGAEKLFGYAAEEVIGKSIMILIPPDRADEEARVLESVRRGKTIDHYETVRRRKDGSLVEISLTVSPLRDEADNVIGASKIAREITDRKRAEEEIARLLTEEQAAREVAEQATRAKDEFLAVVSHELRSPLNAILGWNEYLRSQLGDDPKIAKVTETVERSGKAQLQLIEDLLDTARIITGKMKLEFQPVEPAAVISAALDVVHPAAHSKGVVISTYLDPQAGQIIGDPDRLQQVAWNLVSNAIKFTPSGGRVQVELRRGGAGVQIVVEDTGQGIEPDLLPYIFDRFKQGDSSTSRRLGGLGLGLSLVKHIVELHGGSVAVESPGKGLGTTFIVNLPVRAVRRDSMTESQRAGETAVDRHAGRRTRTDKLEGVRALVVDDEPGARELLTATLEQYGVLVTGADSATAALAALESQFGDEGSEPFDILISDIEMPDTDGYELMQRIREHADRRVRRIRAIALTAYGRSEDRLKALQAGFQMHVSKPVDEEELTMVIATLTDRM